MLLVNQKDLSDVTVKRRIARVDGKGKEGYRKMEFICNIQRQVLIYCSIYCSKIYISR